MSDDFLDTTAEGEWTEPRQSATRDELDSLALPGPALTDEELAQELRRGIESGPVHGNVVKRLLRELGTQSGNKAA